MTNIVKKDIRGSVKDLIAFHNFLEFPFRAIRNSKEVENFSSLEILIDLYLQRNWLFLNDLDSLSAKLVGEDSEAE